MTVHMMNGIVQVIEVAEALSVLLVSWWGAGEIPQAARCTYEVSLTSGRVPAEARLGTRLSSLLYEIVLNTPHSPQQSRCQHHGAPLRQSLLHVIMARTFEVGRAVLASTTHNLELWLSTLITLSPSQDSIDVEQPSFHSLTRILSSSDIWVGRGNGMRIELALTHRGEPLPKLNLQMLREMIIQAPVRLLFIAATNHSGF